MKKLFLFILYLISINLFSYSQINPAPGAAKPIPDKTFPQREYIENVELARSYNWWKRVNPTNTIYFQSLNIYSADINNTGMENYAAKIIMSLVGFESYTNTASLSNDSLVYLEPLVNLEKLLVKYDINDAGILHLAKLKRLTHLEASYSGRQNTPSHNEFRDIQNNSMDVIGGLSGLEILRLHYCKSVTDRGLGKLQGLTSLKELDLTEWGINDLGLSSLAAMNKLEVLNLRGTAITDAGVDILISILPGMPSFKKIILSNSLVSARGAQRLLNHFPRVTVL